jgi:hypothetical protein
MRIPCGLMSYSVVRESLHIKAVLQLCEKRLKLKHRSRGRVEVMN